MFRVTRKRARAVSETPQPPLSRPKDVSGPGVANEPTSTERLAYEPYKEKPGSGGAPYEPYKGM